MADTIGDIKRWAGRIRDRAQVVLNDDPAREIHAHADNIRKYANEIIELCGVYSKPSTVNAGPDTHRSLERFEKIIQDWQFSWMKDRDYFERALSVDANMKHDLAERLASAEKGNAQ